MSNQPNQPTDLGDNRLNTYVLPPLPENLPLPPLPPITDPTLYRTAVTHVSVYSIPRNRRDLDPESCSTIADYEKLEYVGDALLGSIVTVLLHETYPNMREGISTLIKSHLICNCTLAQLADRYGITDQVRTSKEMRYVVSRQVKIRGSLFESWVAGVFYSYLHAEKIKKAEEEQQEVVGEQQEEEDSTSKSQSVKSSTLPEVSDDASSESKPPIKATKNGANEEETSSESSDGSESEKEEEEEGATSEDEEEPINLQKLFLSTQPPPLVAAESQAKQANGPRTYGQAFDYLYTWLKPLFVPIAQYSLDCLKREQRNIELGIAAEINKAEKDEVRTLDELSLGARAALNTYCLNEFDETPAYESIRARPGIWRTTCTVVDLDGKEWTGFAERQTKKLGGSVASYLVCQQLKLLK